VYIGDLFDEGKWCSDAEFQDYIHRFEQMFRVPGNTQMQVVVGNHDIGFHYM
jgi:metallophosphoesterase superfamily enzyme